MHWEFGFGLSALKGRKAFIRAKRQGTHSIKQQLQRELKSFRGEQGAGFRQ
jgi:hypothetical protein